MLEGRVHPNLWEAHGIALAVGITVPYVILFLLGLLSYKLENRKELEKITERPVIAEIPMVDDKDNAGVVIRFGVNEAVTEAFRLMRANIHFMLKSNENVILLTSSTSGEGKTFCAANLAMSYALLNKRVVLCGLDIRRPALGKLFEHTDSKRGISILLQKDRMTEADVCQQIQPSGLDPHLDLLQAGPIPPNPTELFGRDSFTQVVSILRKEYDYVIFDTAPVGLVTDTLLIGRHADVTIFVSRYGYTPHYAIAQLNQLAVENKLPNTCFVLNGR
jgi:capsular exopolysaccharide synthesis family protein